MEIKQLTADLTSDLLIATNVSDDMRCGICMEVMTTPLQDNCDFAKHSFCQTCIHSWLEQRQICPMSKKALNKQGLVSNAEAAQKLNDVDTKCPNSRSKCAWIGKVKNLQTHLQICPKRTEIVKSFPLSHPLGDGATFTDALDEATVLSGTMELAAIVMEFSKDIHSFGNTLTYNGLSALQFVFREKANPSGNFTYGQKLGGGVSMNHPTNIDKREVFQIAPGDKLTKFMAYTGSAKYFPCLAFMTQKNPVPVFFGYKELADDVQITEFGRGGEITGLHGTSSWVVAAFGFFVLDKHDD